MSDRKKDNFPKTTVSEYSIFRLGRDHFNLTIQRFNDRALIDLAKSYKKFSFVSAGLTGAGAGLATESAVFIQILPIPTEDKIVLGACAAIGCLGSSLGFYMLSGLMTGREIISATQQRKHLVNSN